jgi:ribosomal protein S18 acetylase RimI-like enzyme
MDRSNPSNTGKEEKQMGEILKDLSPARLVEAIEDSMFSFWVHLGHSPRVELYDGPDMIRFIGDVPSPICNNVLRAQLTADNIDLKIKETLTHFKSPFRWWTSPSTRPADLGSYLEAHGLTHLVDVPGMAANLPELDEDLVSPANLRVECVSDVKTLEQWVHAFTIGYGIPVSAGNFIFDSLVSQGFDLPWRHYIGWLAGEPVACSSLLLDAGVAGIFAVATVPEARGRGIGTALTLVPLREARAMGYRIGVLGSTQMGQGVYHRLGFQEYCKFVIYIWNGEMGQGK